MISFNKWQKYKNILVFKKKSYLFYNQIWLNHLMDDCHLSYIIKLKNETLSSSVILCGKTLQFGKKIQNFSKNENFVTLMIIFPF